MVPKVTINSAPAVIISAVFAFFVAAALTEQALLYTYLSDAIIHWIILAVIIASIMWAIRTHSC